MTGTVFITHSGIDPKYVAMVRKTIEERMTDSADDEIISAEAGELHAKREAVLHERSGGGIDA